MFPSKIGIIARMFTVITPIRHHTQGLSQCTNARKRYGSFQNRKEIEWNCGGGKAVHIHGNMNIFVENSKEFTEKLLEQDTRLIFYLLPICPTGV